jgi:hypothetical protein
LIPWLFRFCRFNQGALSRTNEAVGTRVQPTIEAVSGLAKLKRWLLIGATVLHLAAMVGSSAPRVVRSAAQKLFRPYTSGLRMGSSWEMFIRPPQDSIVEIVGVKRSGEEITLETANATNKSWLSRVRDARQRKILSTLSSPPQLFRIGRAILMHACREARALDVVEVRAVIVHARKLRPDGSVEREAFQTVVLTRDCSDPSLGAADIAAEAQEEP